MITPDTLDGVLDHPLQYFFILVSFGYQVSDVDESVLGGVKRDFGHEASVADQFRQLLWERGYSL